MVGVTDPGPEDFRALGRSSPWLWRTVRVTYGERRWRPLGPERTELVGEPVVRAWIRRPGSLRVEGLDGTLRTVEVLESPGAYTSSVMVAVCDDGNGVSDAALARLEQEARDAAVARRDAPPRRRPDGLVARRPEDLGHEHDVPMWQNYLWVAVFDPVELADAGDPEPRAAPAAEVGPVGVVDHHGRPAWQAVLTPLPGYDPRCSCCPIMHSAASDAREAEAGVLPEPGRRYAHAHRIRLDAGTGICVSSEELGGPRAGAGHEIVIEAVDEEMPDELFERPGRAG